MFMVQLFRNSFESTWFFNYEESAMEFAEENVDRGAIAHLWKYNEAIDGMELVAQIS